jgi:hypothetical protein
VKLFSREEPVDRIDVSEEASDAAIAEFSSWKVNLERGSFDAQW